MKVLTYFALEMARPSRASDEHVKWRSRLHLENIGPHFVLNTLTTQIRWFFFHFGHLFVGTNDEDAKTYFHIF